MNAVITGASRGIGRALAEIFATHGYDLYLCSKSESTLLETISELKAQFPNVSIDGRALDLTTKSGAQLFGQWVTTQADDIDVLINNAGTFIQGSLTDEEDGNLEKMMAVNLYSAYHTTRAVLPKMIAARSGHIFCLCSIASLAAYPNGGSYSISKYALLGFAKNLRLELADKGIKVTAVMPGAVYTDSWKGSGVSEDRIMKPRDIAETIYALSQLSPQATPEEVVLRPQLGDI